MKRAQEKALALTRSVYRHKWLGRESSRADLLSEHRVAVGWWLFSSKINQDLLIEKQQCTILTKTMQVSAQIMLKKWIFLFSYLLLVYILYGIENTFRKYKLDFLDCCCNFNNKMTSTTLVIIFFFSNLVSTLL